jgi:hypothetical protein
MEFFSNNGDTRFTEGNGTRSPFIGHLQLTTEMPTYQY